MRNYNALIFYDDGGRTIRREKVTVMFSCGEPYPKDQVINIELPVLPDGTHRCINLSRKQLEDACGFKKIRERRRRD